MKRAARIDRNQPEIVKALRRVGATVLVLSQLKGAFDILVIYQGSVHIVEIKDGNKLPQKFETMSEDEKRGYLESKLTDGEKKCMERVQRQGVPYKIVYDINSSIKAIT